MMHNQNNAIAFEYWFDKIKQTDPEGFHPTLKSSSKTVCINMFEKEMSQKFTEVTGRSVHNEMVLFLAIVASVLNKFGCSRPLVTCPWKNGIGFFEFDFIQIHDTQGLLEEVKKQYLEGVRHSVYDVETLRKSLRLNKINALDYLGAKVIGHYSIKEPVLDYPLQLKVSLIFQKGRYGIRIDDRVLGKELANIFAKHLLVLTGKFLTGKKTDLRDLQILGEELHRYKSLEPIETTIPANCETLIQLFEQQVRQTADKVAIYSGKEELTYRQLNERSNQLAYTLREQHSIKNGKIVGIMLGRSAEAVIAILAVLKAGGAYLPIDSEYPIDWSIDLIRRSGAKLLITCKAITAFQNNDEIGVSIIDIDDKLVFDPHNKNLETSTDASSLCYMIYTSGTTGQSKGVMVENGSIVNYLSWAKKHYFEEGPLNFPLFTSLSFDLTITSLFLPLISGSSLIIYDQEFKDETLEEILNDPRVGIIKLTPSHLKFLEPEFCKISLLKKVIVGGENFESGLARHLNSCFTREIKIFNEYGPTEATVGCMIHQYDEQHDLDDSVPIGVPIPNTGVYILDQYKNWVPPGIPGELYIMGKGVARGYFQNIEETDKRFLPNPYQKTERLYRTGDLARLLPDGKVVYLGRVGRSVKLNGFRIDSIEIENTLKNHPKVKDGLVHIQDVSIKEKKEITYCVKCGMPSNYPNISFNHEGICSTCVAFDGYKEKANTYFRTREDLQYIFKNDSGLKERPYDCIMLLSGGKDSTYALFQLVKEMGLRVLAFSLDNGFISEGAIENMKKVTKKLQVDLVFGRTPHMNAIFVDSLKRHKNVCDGCFKTIYTLSANLAKEKGIKYIVTGLSRGQLFETRLNELFAAGIFKEKRLNESVLAVRKEYHRVDDTVSRLLDVELFKDDRFFEEVKFIDFYRYHDVDLDTVYDYIEKHASWIRPSDTGRSTNCLINDLGIYTHKKKRGYHNYALPYSWDVRMGHKSRKDALDELDDDINQKNMTQIMQKIGYTDFDLEEGQKKLVAYYVPREEVDSYEIRAFLNDSLPAYMIPTLFIPITKVPLTLNGKVDKDILEQLAIKQNSRVYKAPTNEIERRLVAIWKSLLKVDKIGITDRFFELGGHSMKAIQATRLIQKEFGKTIKMTSIFKAQTIQKLAVELKKAEIGTLTPIQPKEEQDYYNLSYAQKKLWLFDQAHPRLTVYNIHSAFQIEGSMDSKALNHTYLQLLKRHESLRTVFVSVKGRPFQKVLRIEDFRGYQVEYITMKTLNQQNIGVNAWIAKEGSTHFDLKKGPLFRLKVLQVDDKYAIIQLHLHHIIADGVSYNILTQDLREIYNAILQKKYLDHKALKFQYRDYIAWRRVFLEASDSSQAVNFWKEQFNTRIPRFSVPGYRRPAVKSYNGSLHTFYLDENASNNLSRISVELGNTLFTTLLTSVYVLLHKISGQQEFIIGSPVEGRTHHELEQQVGLFINTLPFKGTINPEHNFSKVVSRVNTNVIEVFQNDFVPIEYIEELLDTKADPSRAPLFDVLFLFENRESPNNALQVHKPATSSSKFDLSIGFVQTTTNIKINLEYNTDIFDQQFALLFEYRYTRLVELLTENYHVKIGNLELQPPQHKKSGTDIFDFDLNP